MTESQAASEPRDHRVQAALQDYLERVDRGETVDRDAFLEQHPEIADELRSFIETDENIARLAEESSTSSAARRDAETLVPRKVQGKSSATDSGQLPPQFGRYRVLKPLGSGAMGTVYLAEDTQLQRKVALKTPSFDEDDSGELLERFYREARAAAVLRHSNICPVFDVDQIDGRHFISMAYIEGRPLSAYIQPDNPPTERQVLLIIRKLALALREAHEHGIVHRDLKPGNIMIDPRGEPIIMDFGLARRVTTDEDHRITQSGVLVGSPAYMSPEQVEGQPDKVGPASDQYSLGVILYEMLTGQLPFRGSITGVIGQILTKTPTPPGELREGLDLRIEALCQKMLAKRADDRFPSVKDVVDEVARILKSPKPPTRLAATGGSANAPASTPSITDSNVASLYEAARKCMRKRDYEQVVQMLETIPEDRRNDDVMRLLAKARQLSDEVQFLLAEIDEALHANDTETARKKSGELLKLKPGHHRAQEVRQQCARGGRPSIRSKRRTRDGRRVTVGSWIPWAVAIVALVAIGVTSWLVYDYLHSGRTVPAPDAVAGHGSPPALAPVELPRLDAIGLSVKDVAFTHDGTRLVSANVGWKTETGRPISNRPNNGTVWDTVTGRPRLQLEGPMTRSAKAVALSLDDRYVVLGSTGEHLLNVWDLQSGDHVRELGVRGEVFVRAVEFFPDGRTVAAACDDGTVRIWNVQTNKALTIQASEASDGNTNVWDVAILAEGREVVSISKEGLQRWDAVTGDRIALLSTGGMPWSLDVSDHGEFAVLSSDTSVLIWNVEDDLLVPAPVPEHDAKISRVVLLHDDRRLATGTFDGIIRLWDLESGVLLWTSERHDGEVHGLSVSPDGTLLASSTIGAWDEERVDYVGGEPFIRLWRLTALRADSATPAPDLAVAPFDPNAAARHQRQWADYLEVPVSLTNSIGMEFRLIPPGEFASEGSDGDATRIDRPFYLGVHEVTQEQCQRVIGVNPSDRKAPENPVHNVTWDQAEAFCQRLSEFPENAGYVFRLPTEAEWEHACRAGSTAAYGFGDDASRLRDYAWFSENANNTMHPVGRKTANAWGMYDMHANVWEWCRDELDSQRPIRGGCWYSGAELCTSGARRLIPASDQSVLVGFRVVREIEPAPPVSDGWTDLFNGRDLTGWTPVESQGGWQASASGIRCDDQGQGWLATQREYSDFELELEFKLTPAANSGVFLRMPRSASPNGAGLLEVQLLDETAAQYAGIPADRHSGALYGIAAPQPRVNIGPNVWHSLHIQAAGPRITVEVNGRQVIDTGLDSNSQLRQEKPDALRASGFIGLQRLNSSVEFRNIRIKESVPGTD